MTGIEIDDDVVPVLPGKSKLNCGPSEPSASPVLSSGTADEATLMLRLRALTMPSLTEFERPSGAPMTTVRSPTLSSEELAVSIGVRPLASSSLMTARSVIASVPTIVAL